MKKFALPVGIALLSVLIAGCSDDNEPAQQPLPAPQVSGITATTTSITVKWTAVEGAEAYSYVFPADAAEKTTTETHLTLSDLNPGTSYTLKIRATGKAPASEYTEINLATASEFTFTVADLTSTGGVITVTPADPEMPFFWDVILNSEVKEKSDAAILALFQETYGEDLTGSIVSGVSSLDMTGWMLPGRIYSIVAFGFDETSKSLTTKVYTQELYTPSEEESSLTFRINVSNITTVSASYTITPSENTEFYYTSVYPTELESYGKEVVIALMLDELEEAITAEGYEKAEARMLHKGVFTGTVTGLKAGVSYKTYAIGIKHTTAVPTVNVVATTDLASGEAFTPAK